MALIDKETIRKEIEWRRDFYLGHANACIGTNIVDGFDEVLAILDTLEAEEKDKAPEQEYRVLQANLSLQSKEDEHPGLAEIHYRQAAEGLAMRLLEYGLLEMHREVDIFGHVHYIVIARVKKP